MAKGLECLFGAQRAKEGKEAIRSGKMKTKPWEEVKAALKEKGLLDDESSKQSKTE